MKLPAVRGKYKLNYNLLHLTWFKVGGAADVFFKPEDIDDLTFFLKENNGTLPVMILGAGSNVIIRDKGIEGVVIKLGQNFTNIEITPEGISVGAGCLNFNLAKFCQVNSIKGFEFLIGIPGTVGGGIAMNAGSYSSEFKDIVLAVETLDIKGNKKIIPINEIEFSYRKNNLPEELLFTRAVFKNEPGNPELIAKRMEEISAMRAKTQPVTEKTSGSTFANPDGYKAWELIDKAGLRGKKLGGAAISELHCNFMINQGGATATDMEKLGEFIRTEVKKNSGIELTWEIKIIGRNGEF